MRLPFFRRRRREEELDEEIRRHLEMAAHDRVERGETVDDAAAGARREFGNVALVKEVTREMWGWTSLERLAADAGFAVRQMIRNPGFTAVAVLTLALGIGGTTAVFSVVNALLLNPLPYASPERLVWVAETLPHSSEELAPGPHVLEWRERSRTLEQIEAYTPHIITLTEAGEPERLDGVRASAGFLPMLGVRPLLGRHFLPSEDRPGAERVVMLTHALWQRRFGADRDIVGRLVTLDDDSYMVVGVLPSDFRFFQPFELWVPLALDPAEERGHQQLSMLRAIARLRQGVIREDAQAELEAIRHEYEASKPSNALQLDGSARVTLLQDALVGDSRRLLFVLLGAVGLVLLIACANVANLLLARAVTRHREFAVRAALGAGRLRLMRQMLTESVLLAGCGGALGLVAAVWLTGALGRLAAPNPVGAISQVATIAPDVRVLGFTALVALVTGILFGLAPAVQLWRTDIAGSLKSTRPARGARGRGMRHALMILEVALTIVLLAGAGLLVRSFVNLLDVDPGYRRENLLTLRVTLPEARYPERSHRTTFYDDVLQRVSSLPGVQSVAATNSLPLTESMFRGWLTVPGRQAAGDGPPEHPPTPIAVVTPQYFGTMGIPLRAGSTFTDSHHAGAPRVVILSEALARDLFPNEDAVGRQVRVPGAGKGTPTVIGVVGDVRHEGLDRDILPLVYVPLRQTGWPSMTLVVRTASDPLSLAAAVRAEVLAADPHLPVYEVQSMEGRVAQSMSFRRVNLLLVGAFALLALTLAAVGVYGVMAYGVTQRTHEIGIRMALGARGADVLKLIVGEGMMAVGAGVVLGLLGAWALTRIIAGLLFGVSPVDPAVFAGAAALLSVVALIACYVPARRATPISPTIALRCE